MRLQNVGEPVSTYYKGTVQGPPTTGTAVKAAATGAFSQNASGSVSVAGHSGVWLIGALILTFVILHKAGLGGE